MATIFEAVAKQSQNSQQSQSDTNPNQPALHFTGNCITNGLFLFDEPPQATSINMLDNWLQSSKQSRSSLDAAVAAATAAAAAAAAVNQPKIQAAPRSGPFHTIDTGTDHIDLLSSQQHFQFQHPHHPHNQTHSLFLTPSNMDTTQLSQQQQQQQQQSSLQQQSQHSMQQNDQLQTSPNCSFGE